MSSLVKRLVQKGLVFLDTSCFIYAFEDEPQFGSLAVEIFDALSDVMFQVESSIFTVAEVLTKPIQLGNRELASRYEEMFDQLPSFTIRSPSYKTAVNAVKIRAEYSFRLMDSFQLALAKENGCKAFVTNDQQLKQYKGMEVVILSDFLGI